LSHLVNLGLASFALQVDLLLDARFPEHVVTSANTLLKAQPAQELTEVVEGDVRIRCPAQYASQEIIVLGHDSRLQQLCDLA
jgi:hypothetical protein